MTGPSPTALRSYAERLRELAKDQLRHARDCDGLLGDVNNKDGDATWSGTYASCAQSTFGQWATALQSSAAAMRADATSWSQLAERLDAQAAAPAAGG